MIEQDITYTWVQGNTSLTRTRQILGSVVGMLDTQIASGLFNNPQSYSLVVAKALSIFVTSDQAVTLKSGGTNAIETLGSTGTVSGGNFTATVNSQTTANIAWNSTATQVQTALTALTGVTAAGVVCTGGPLPGTPVVCTFAGPLAVQAVTMSVTSSVTGGGSITDTHSTAGVAPDTTISLLAGVPLVWDSLAYFSQPFAANVSTLYVTNSSGAGANLKIRTLANA